MHTNDVVKGILGLAVDLTVGYVVDTAIQALVPVPNGNALVKGAFRFGSACLSMMVAGKAGMYVEDQYDEVMNQIKQLPIPSIQSQQTP